MRGNHLVVCILMLISCNGLLEDPNQNGLVNNSHADQQIEDIKFNGEFSTTSGDWYLPDNSDVQKAMFNIKQFSNIDSIIFRTSIRSKTENFRCIAQLFDITNNRPIVNSAVYSKVRYTLHTVESEDLKHYLPQTPVLLGVRIRSEKQGDFVAIGQQSRIIIYYH